MLQVNSKQQESKWVKVSPRSVREQSRATEICTKDAKEQWDQKWVERRKQRKGERQGEDMERKMQTEQRPREEDRQRERPPVSSFLLVIGFSDWSKLFFSILLSSLSRAGTFSPPLRGWKIKRTGPTVWLALVHSSGLLKPIFQLTEQRKTGRDG